MPKCKKCGVELVASVSIHEPYVWGNAAALPAGGQTFQMSASMCWHEADGGPLVVIEQQELDALRERLAQVERDNAVMRERLTSHALADYEAMRGHMYDLEQREQQARAIIEAVADGRVLGDPDVFLATHPTAPRLLQDQARAWLAAQPQAEQRAATQEEVNNG